MDPLSINLNELYITPAEACRYLSLEPYQVKSLVYAKKIAYQMVGGRSLLVRADVEALATKGAVTVSAPPDPIEQQKKLQQSYGIPLNTADVNTSPGYSTQFYPASLGQK